MSNGDPKDPASWPKLQPPFRTTHALCPDEDGHCQYGGDDVCPKIASRSSATLSERLERLGKKLMATTEFGKDAHTVLEAAIALVSETEASDTARLDDMERTRCYPFWNGNGWTYIVAPERSSKIERKGMGATVREAIDDAMRPSGNDRKTGGA